MTDEQIAFRSLWPAKAHRRTLVHTGPVGYYVNTACGAYLPPGLSETLPLSQTAPEDRCKTCWKEADR